MLAPTAQDDPLVDAPKKKQYVYRYIASTPDIFRPQLGERAQPQPEEQRRFDCPRLHICWQLPGASRVPATRAMNAPLVPATQAVDI